jgi:hypothetical protein
MEKKLETRLADPVTLDGSFKMTRFAQNPSAAMRGGFLC